MTDTIFALSSGAGRAGIAVFRLSGPQAGAALLSLTRRARLPEPRRAERANLWPAAGSDPLDHGLVLWFPAPKSFTGEDVAELHLHGGRAVVAAAVAALGATPGLRPAEPGEFTRRAFANGKFDLTAVEGLADLVAAETEAQRRQALRQMDGALARLYDGWRDRLLRALAHCEAEIDFADEDLGPSPLLAVRGEMAALTGEIAAHLADRGRGERLRDGVSIVILGAPNVGKSSLLNALAGSEAAIVAGTAGTTRDIVEVRLDLAGLPVVIADTAGLRASADRIESEGIRRARARAEVADLKLLVTPAPDWPQIAEETEHLFGPDALLVVSKLDLCPDMGRLLGLPRKWPAGTPATPVYGLSVATGEGVPELLTALEEAARRLIDVSGTPALTRERHRHALESCVESLTRFQAQEATELAAEDLRLAARAVGRITGRIDVEDLLDTIFRDFCLGK